jgi:hypothetical protein
VWKAEAAGWRDGGQSGLLSKTLSPKKVTLIIYSFYHFSGCYWNIFGLYSKIGLCSAWSGIPSMSIDFFWYLEWHLIRSKYSKPHSIIYNILTLLNTKVLSELIDFRNTYNNWVINFEIYVML